jgi:hypothetical protein
LLHSDSPRKLEARDTKAAEKRLVHDVCGMNPGAAN